MNDTSMTTTGTDSITEPMIGNEMFLRNMRVLWRRDPQLALRVDAVNDNERLPVETTRSGQRTAQMARVNGNPVYLHSRHDPVAEALRFASSVPIEGKFCFVVSGLGLGYHVKALFERLHSETVIICTEPSIKLIATALTCVDLSELIDSGRLIILTDGDKARIHERLKSFNTLVMLGAQFVHHRPSMQVDEQVQAQAQISALIAEFVTYTRMSLVTLMSNAKITCRNIAMNLVHYVTTPPLDMLRGRFSGIPGIVISAGPSLSKNISQLADLKGKAVLCAVQTAVKPLIQRGIKPDFITTLDFHEMSTQFFQGVEGLEETHLIAEPKATWGILDHYPGPVSLLHNAWAQLVLGDELGVRGGLPAGATVAHLAFYLAQYLGCDPIIFVGQDLAFTGHVFYIPGVEVHQSWKSEINRFCTMEQKEWERIVRNRPILRRVAANQGGELYTDELLFTYLEQFEKDIIVTPARVINATEGGVRIRGTETLTLAEATQKYSQKTIEPVVWDYRKATQWKDPSKISGAAEALAKRLKELDESITVCDELLELLAELNGLTHDPDRFNRKIARVDDLRSRIHQDSRPYRIINSATQLAEFRRFSADRRIEAQMDESEVERAKRRIARDIEFITAVRDGAGEVRPLLTRALERLKGAAQQP